jgi:hypothetical protein
MTGNYLITTDNWFIAPDGKSYRSVYGNVQIVSDAILGIKTNVRSSNWFAKVGAEDNHVIIAGCQIHYAVKCINKPNLEDVEEYTTEGGFKKFDRPSQIYDAS